MNRYSQDPRPPIHWPQPDEHWRMRQDYIDSHDKIYYLDDPMRVALVFHINNFVDIETDANRIDQSEYGRISDYVDVYIVKMQDNMVFFRLRHENPGTRMTLSTEEVHGVMYTKHFMSLYVLAHE